ncbi:MAG: WD40 repeat domain-containing serine/threonine protein kinase [Planctomycetota bacterium]
MDGDRFRAIRQLLEEVAELPLEQRQHLYREHLASDSVIREVEDLLAEDDAETLGGAFEDSQPGALGRFLLDAASPSSKGTGGLSLDSLREWNDELRDGHPERIGPFRITGRLGEGGMGMVFRGIREGTTDEAAVKVLHPASYSKHALQRFLREAGMLRRLDHPAIARFLEADSCLLTTATGLTVELPYIAMELIDGFDLLQHANSRDLGRNDRLELFLRIARAVEHAHGRQIIHRDLKPSNILVVSKDDDPVGSPKLVDFGVALVASDESLSVSISRTRSGALLGTLPYMSPEQVSGQVSDIDERSDLYSLGVILFELLSGRLPYPVRGKPLPEVARIIQDDPPERLGSVVTALRGPLERVVATCLEKEPEYRYPSVTALREDLERFRAGERIRAREPSLLEQLRRVARRNPTLLRSAIVIAVILVVATLVSLGFALRESRIAEEKSELARVARRKAYASQLRIAAAALHEGEWGSVRDALVASEGPETGWEWHHLRSRLPDELRTIAFEAPEEECRYSLAFDPEEERLWMTTSQESGPSELWSFDLIGTGAPTRAPIEDVTDAALSAKAHLHLANDRGAWVQKLSGAKQLRQPASALDTPLRLPAEHRRQTRSADANGRWRVEIHRDEIQVLSADGTIVRRIDEGGRREFRAMRLGVTHDWLAYGLTGGELVLWNLSDRSETARPSRSNEHTESIASIVFDGGGDRMATADFKGRVILWSLNPLRVAQVLPGHQDAVLALAFSASGRFLASVSRDGQVKVWSAEGRRPWQLQPLDQPYLYAATWSSAGDRILVGTPGGELVEFDARSSERIRSIVPTSAEHMVRSLDWQPGGSLVAMAQWTGAKAALMHPSDSKQSIQLFDTDSGRSAWRREVSSEISWSAAWMPDGRTLLAFHPGVGIVVHDVESGEDRIREIPLTSSAPNGSACLRLDASGELLAAANAGHLEVFRWPSLEPILSWSGETIIRDMAVSADGQRLAIACRDRIARLFDLEHPRRGPLELIGHSAPVYSVELLDGGKRLLTGSDDHTVRIWDPVDGSWITELRGHEDYIWRVAASPDGRQFLTASGDGSCRIWNVETIQERLAARVAYREAKASIEKTVDGWAEQLGPEVARRRIASESRWSPRVKQVARQLLSASAWAR